MSRLTLLLAGLCLLPALAIALPRRDCALHVIHGTGRLPQ